MVVHHNYVTRATATVVLGILDYHSLPKGKGKVPPGCLSAEPVT